MVSNIFYIRPYVLSRETRVDHILHRPDFHSPVVYARVACPVSARTRRKPDDLVLWNSGRADCARDRTAHCRRGSVASRGADAERRARASDRHESFARRVLRPAGRDVRGHRHAAHPRCESSRHGAVSDGIDSLRAAVAVWDADRSAPPGCMSMAAKILQNQIRRLRFEHKEMTQRELADKIGV